MTSPDEEHGDSGHEAGMPQSGTGGYHPHESPLTMLVPIVLLAIGAVLAGQLFHEIFVDPGGAPASGAARSHSAERLAIAAGGDRRRGSS